MGSRNANEGDLYFARKLGGEAAAAGYSIVSGGARGIDESAMLGARRGRHGDRVLSDRLLKAATSSKFRPALMAEEPGPDLALSIPKQGSTSATPWRETNTCTAWRMPP